MGDGSLARAYPPIAAPPRRAQTLLSHEAERKLLPRQGCTQSYRFPSSLAHVFSMSGKRSRAAYEAELQAQQSPFVVFGTALPPQDPDVRDDGSYIPVWKQEVRDERGLKRLHGAFTGGWSAG